MKNQQRIVYTVVFHNSQSFQVITETLPWRTRCEADLIIEYNLDTGEMKVTKDRWGLAQDIIITPADGVALILSTLEGR